MLEKRQLFYVQVSKASMCSSKSKYSSRASSAVVGVSSPSSSWIISASSLKCGDQPFPWGHSADISSAISNSSISKGHE